MSSEKKPEEMSGQQLSAKLRAAKAREEKRARMLEELKRIEEKDAEEQQREHQQGTIDQRLLTRALAIPTLNDKSRDAFENMLTFTMNRLRNPYRALSTRQRQWVLDELARGNVALAPDGNALPNNVVDIRTARDRRG